MKVLIFSALTSCILLYKYQRFIGAYCLLLSSNLKYTENKIPKRRYIVYLSRRCYIPEYWGLQSSSSPCTICFHIRFLSCDLVQGDQKVSMHLMMVITDYIRKVDGAILNTVFENKVRRVNKCLENGGGHF